jgi:uncharacterized protein YjbI with pentapeptide repeats
MPEKPKRNLITGIAKLFHRITDPIVNNSFPIIITIIVTVPLVWYGIKLYEDHLISAAGGALTSIIIGCLLFLFIYIYKDEFLESVNLGKVVAKQDLISPVEDAVDSFINKRNDEGKDHLIKFIKNIFFYYSWMTTRKTIISTTLGLFVVFGALVGSALLVKQNKILVEQTLYLHIQNSRMLSQNGLIADQNQYFQDQNEKIQKQLDQQKEEQNQEYRNELISILYEEKYIPDYPVTSPPQKLPEYNLKVPKYNIRIRNEALHDFIELESKILKSQKTFSVNNESIQHSLNVNLRYSLLDNTDWRTGDIFSKTNIKLDLSHAQLRDCNMAKISLMGVLLKGAHLERTDLDQANLKNSHLEKANLEEANLEGVHLERSHLRGVNLKRAHLRGTHFEEADLERANLEGAVLIDVHFERTYLEKVRFEGAYVDSLDWIEKTQNIKPPPRGFEAKKWIVKEVEDFRGEFREEFNTNRLDFKIFKADGEKSPIDQNEESSKDPVQSIIKPESKIEVDKKKAK